MSNKTIIFGRDVQGPNTKLIAASDVSSQHAKITDLGNNQFELEDLGSSNGTYVNGYRIRKTIVGINDQVRLSSGVVLDLVKEFGLNPSITPNQDIKKSNPKDFTVEFERLKPVYEQFKKDLKKARIGHSKKMTYIRTGITLAPIPIIIYAARDGSFSGIGYVSLLAAAVANFVTGGMDNQDKVENLIEDFRIKYVCPNTDCSIQLGHNNSWNLIHENPGKCFRCGSVYNKNKL